MVIELFVRKRREEGREGGREGGGGRMEEDRQKGNFDVCFLGFCMS